MPFVLHPSGYCVWYNESSKGNLITGAPCPVCRKVAGHSTSCIYFQEKNDKAINSRPKLYNATSILWHKNPDIKFFTFTLPSRERGTYQVSATDEVTGDLAVASKFSMLLENVSVNVKRNSGEKFSYVWISEAQMKRQKKFGGIGDIHYHLVTDAWVDIKWIQARWNDLTGIESKNSVDVQSIPRSVRSVPAYLVKYLGKGSQRYIYSRRFACSRDLSALVPIKFNTVPDGITPVSQKVISQPNGWETCLYFFNTREIIDRFGPLMRDEKNFDVKRTDKNFTKKAISDRAEIRAWKQMQDAHKEQSLDINRTLYPLFYEN